MDSPENQPDQAPRPTPAETTPPAETPAGSMSKNEQTMGMLCHLTALAAFLIPGVGHVFGGHLIGPLIVWMIKRNEMPFVESQGKESLNFQISITIYGILASILIIVLIGFVLLAAVAIFNVVCVIMASIETANGKPYRYPLCIRFIK